MSNKLRKDYFFDEPNKIIYWAENFPENTNMEYLGASDNPKHVIAAASFMQQGKFKGRHLTGLKVREYTEK